MRYAQRARVQFIVDALISQGSFSRSEIIEKFGISGAQASSDIRAVQNTHPGLMRYHGAQRRFFLVDRSKLVERADCPHCSGSGKVPLDELREFATELSVQASELVNGDGALHWFATAPGPDRRVNLGPYPTKMLALIAGVRFATGKAS